MCDHEWCDITTIENKHIKRSLCVKCGQERIGWIVSDGVHPPTMVWSLIERGNGE